MDINCSMGPAVCRVCLCGESSIPYLGKYAGEPLISPCHCKGTMGLYHRSCLEHWLSTSRTTCCEICKFKYEVGRRKQGIRAYIRIRGWKGPDGNNKRFMTDLMCMMSLGPIAFYITYLCGHTAFNTYSSNEPTDRGAFAASVIMAVFVLLIFLFWLGMTFFHHYAEFKNWQNRNEILFIVDQLDIELSQQYNTTYNRLSESRRPLIKRKLRSIFKKLCCAKKRPSTLRMRETALDLNPHLIGVLDRRMMVAVDFWDSTIVPYPTVVAPPPLRIHPRNRDFLQTNPTSYLSPRRHQGIFSPTRESPVEMSSFRVACTKESGYLRTSTPSSTSSPRTALSSHNYDVPPDARYSSQEVIEYPRGCDLSPQAAFLQMEYDSPHLNSMELYESPRLTNRDTEHVFLRDRSPNVPELYYPPFENHYYYEMGRNQQQQQLQRIITDTVSSSSRTLPYSETPI